ncbi:MAG TPA: hypothetical protein VJ063_14175 [Verrucomicrobiae bacterium]|nr:hypothetical protein [Verrucomicrobiae bacterium]
MNKIAVFSGLAAACLLSGCLEPPKAGKTSDTGVIYRHHFIGASALSQGTNATKLKEVLTRPSTKKLGAELAKKLAPAPREYWTNHLPKKARSGAEYIEPLLPDLYASESYIEARGALARPECIIAVQLADDRASVWDKHLKDLAAAWQLGKPAEMTGQKGWEIKRRDYPNKLQFVRAGKWVLLSFGSDKNPLSADGLQTLGKSGSPVKALAANALLEFEADLPRIAPGVPALANRHLPPTQLTVFGRGEFIRTEAQLRYGQSLNWKFEPWRIPTNVIPDTIISFTAAQGLAPLLSRIEGVTELGVKPTPNQIALWGIGDAQGQVFASVPVSNATNTIQRLAQSLPNVVLKHFPQVMGNFGWVSNRATILWQGLPFIVPYLQPIRSGSSDYVLFGMFPRVQTSNAPPAELFGQLGDRKDLAYYDWEVTGQRVTHARQLVALAHLINKRRVEADTNHVGELWLRDVAEVLGPTVTEITVKSQNELNLVRKSHIGFTGFELAALSLWLESEHFPLRFELRPPVDKRPPNSVAPKPGGSSSPPAGTKR